SAASRVRSSRAPTTAPRRPANPCSRRRADAGGRSRRRPAPRHPDRVRRRARRARDRRRRPPAGSSPRAPHASPSAFLHRLRCRAMPRESHDERRRRAGRIAKRLARAYPDVRTALRFSNPFELLVATILSAQCTDKKVNEVTAVVFQQYGTPAALAAAAPAAIEAIVHPAGFFPKKAKSIQSVARELVERFGGEVPAKLEELIQLRGVARKTANVVLGSAFGVPGIAVDTH